MRGYSQDLRDKAMELYKTGNCFIIKPEHESRRSIFTNKQAILDYLLEHPDADGIELRNNLAPHVSQSCFYNTLNRMGITYKKEVNYKQRCEIKRALFTE